MKLVIVGLGSLGSAVAVESAKRSLALEYELGMTLIDFDTVEERNVVAQDFHPEDIGAPKVAAIDRLISQYKTVKSRPMTERLTDKNIQTMFELDDTTILVDCVDHLPTRQLLWSHGLSNPGIPVVHAGMDEKGMGYVQWNFNLNEVCIDTFSLSPRNISPSLQKKLTEKKENKVIPPCELNGYRSMILNTALATVNAVFILAGHDVMNVIGENDTFGILTNWVTTPFKMEELEAMRTTTNG